jgi:hypothetical protein
MASATIISAQANAPSQVLHMQNLDLRSNKFDLALVRIQNPESLPVAGPSYVFPHEVFMAGTNRTVYMSKSHARATQEACRLPIRVPLETVG